jgi:hypothetical protein
MRFPILIVAALALVAGCSKPDRDASSGRTNAPAQAQSNTPATPANIGQPGSQEEKKEGANPVQGQVDPKAPEQHRDFKQSGDSAGPKGPDTMPKRGG